MLGFKETRHRGLLWLVLIPKMGSFRLVFLYSLPPKRRPSDGMVKTHQGTLGFVGLAVHHDPQVLFGCALLFPAVWVGNSIPLISCGTSPECDLIRRGIGCVMRLFHVSLRPRGDS